MGTSIVTIHVEYQKLREIQLYDLYCQSSYLDRASDVCLTAVNSAVSRKNIPALAQIGSLSTAALTYIL